jgi:hypothetical protein
MNYLKQWGLALMLYAEKHGDQLPDSLANAAGLLPESAAEHGAIAGLDIDGLELMYHGKWGAVGNASAAIVARERAPWPAQDRPGLRRTYVFADGHSEIHAASDGNFEPWEAEHVPVQRAAAAP